MRTHTVKSKTENKKAGSNSKSENKEVHQFIDKRGESNAYPTVQRIFDKRNGIQQLKISNQALDISASLSPIQRKENHSGLPDQLKSGIEQLSGIAMDDVKVHYNSSQPAQLNAHAFAQGPQIHIAPGQQKHLPHEAWHVVQQKQGRVKPTLQMKGKTLINDDVTLEKEADVMGAKANSSFNKLQLKIINDTRINQSNVMQRIVVAEASLDPLQDNLFLDIKVAGRPPTLLGAAQGNHTTPFAVFVSGIRNHVRGRTYTQAFNNIINIAKTDYENLPGMSLVPQNANAIAAYQNFLNFKNQINPNARAERHWIPDIQGLTVFYLNFRNLVPLSTEAGDPHGGDNEGPITQELELIDSRLKHEHDYLPPKAPIKVLFTSLFDANNTLGAGAVEQHKFSLVNAYPTAYDYANS